MDSVLQYQISQLQKFSVVNDSYYVNDLSVLSTIRYDNDNRGESMDVNDLLVEVNHLTDDNIKRIITYITNSDKVINYVACRAICSFIPLFNQVFTLLDNKDSVIYENPYLALKVIRQSLQYIIRSYSNGIQDPRGTLYFSEALILLLKELKYIIKSDKNKPHPKLYNMFFEFFTPLFEVIVSHILMVEPTLSYSILLHVLKLVYSLSLSWKKSEGSQINQYIDKLLSFQLYETVFHSIYSNQTIMSNYEDFCCLHIYLFKIYKVLLTYSFNHQFFLLINSVIKQYITLIKSLNPKPEHFSLYVTTNMHFYSFIFKYLLYLLTLKTDAIPTPTQLRIYDGITAISSHIQIIPVLYTQTVYTHILNTITENDDILFFYLIDSLTIYQLLKSTTVPSSIYQNSLISLLNQCTNPYINYESLYTIIGKDSNIFIEYLVTNLNFLQYLLNFLFLLTKDIESNCPLVTLADRQLIYKSLLPVFKQINSKQIQSLFPYNIVPLSTRLQVVFDSLNIKKNLTSEDIHQKDTIQSTLNYIESDDDSTSDQEPSLSMDIEK
ncbi:hypothetical protein WA158_004650 [Blastocystis sp. Blastoise]